MVTSYGITNKAKTPIGSDKQTFSVLNCEYFIIHQFQHLLWVLKRIDTVLSSTHNICFGSEMSKIFFNLCPLNKPIKNVILNSTEHEIYPADKC